MKVLICAGGTGGGIYPALSAATELQRLGVGREDILWVGTRGEMEEQLVSRAGLKLEMISGGPVVSVPPHVMIMNGMKLAWSIGTASRLIGRFQPDVMFMTGGYMAAPVTLAARRRGVPIVIYLPDVEPGSSIRFSLRFAEKVACTSPDSRQFVPPEKMVVTGYPVRAELRAAAGLSKAEALGQFDLPPGRKTLFVFGGSRGARNINRALTAVLPELLVRFQVIHISGTLTWPEVETHAAALAEDLRRWYRPFPYLHEEMGAAFRAADLVVARAGASMMGEGPAFGLPSVLVPLAWAWRYQKVNADFLTEQGTAVQLTDEQLPDQLLPTVFSLLDDEARLAQMSAAAKALDKPDAAVHLAQTIIDVAGARSGARSGARRAAHD
ncbi:MAG: UDP-N-acetylglucosamine--N-acetylmuramyl-(pentapeptide) pyrophosphoryl-undecaprenol N-acetylglucosamine transferase [Ardenticatenaceae bacterium]|nr:UDP-N-acetylglucosamine--N-acetylmuramyl-(pentapeptide) pyrophosphoryl-undecaprenol N-acetylglucosamine transferase [Ardenticatenaceae bacterium]MCB9442829.1 UDP-N-acetylglucosamine--N-acetylmuramyl-(pentapeptide) pyrophosphoryl-undecaprenol N-acetylglucosamine transferase [Ardenticatenaceae bacterium]